MIEQDTRKCWHCAKPLLSAQERRILAVVPVGPKRAISSRTAAEKAGTNPSATQHVLGRLVDLGLILRTMSQRRENPNDRSSWHYEFFR